MLTFANGQKVDLSNCTSGEAALELLTEVSMRTPPGWTQILSRKWTKSIGSVDLNVSMINPTYYTTSLNIEGVVIEGEGYVHFVPAMLGCQQFFEKLRKAFT